MLSIEFAIKNYIESWGQTFGTPDFDMRVLPCRPPGPKSQGSNKSKFITPIDPTGVVTNGFPVKNYTGFCYRGIFYIDQVGSYVPNTSRLVLRFYWRQQFKNKFPPGGDHRLAPSGVGGGVLTAFKHYVHVCMCVCVCLSVCLSVCLPVCLSVCLSVFLSVCCLCQLL